MKKKILLPLMGMLSLAAFGAGEAGHIYEVRAWDLQNNCATNYDFSADNPLKGGQKVGFVVRLLNSNWLSCNSTTMTNWDYPTPVAGSFNAVWYATPPKIGIVVSGRTVGATIEAIMPDYIYNPSSYGAHYYTDIVCSYTVQPGDFALPIRLAADGDGTPVSDLDSAQLYIENGIYWNWYCEGGSDEIIFKYVNLSGTPATIYKNPPEGSTYTRQADDLSRCGFYARTVDFTDSANESGSWHSATVWRGVHEKSSSPEPSLASLTVTGEPTEASKLYVWSDKPGVIDLPDGVATDVYYYDAGKNRIEPPVSQKVYEISLEAGKTLYTFKIEAQATASERDTATLYLSQYPGFTYTSNILNEDFLTIPVAVIEPEKASVTATAASEKVTVSAVADDVSTAVGTITLKVSGGYTQFSGNSDLTVTLTPSLQDGTAGWSNYVHIATSSDGAAWTEDKPLVVKFSSDTDSGDYDADFAAGKDVAKTVYVYALGADEHTSTAGHAIYFEPALDADAVAANYFQTPLAKAVMYFVPSKPTLDVPAAYSAVGGSSRSFELTVGDNYKNVSDEGGYTVYYKQKSSDSAWKTLAGGWKPNAQGVLVSTNDATVLPSLTYAYADTPYTTVFKVKTPGGDLESNEATTTVTVSKPATATAWASADGGTTFVESATFTENALEYPDGLEIPVHVVLSETYSEKLWAFLAVTDPAMTNLVSGSVLTNFDGAIGMEIPTTGPTSAEGYITLLDGGKGSGNNIQFSVILCKSQTFDASKVEDYFQSGNTLTLKMRNAAPTVRSVTMDGLTTIEKTGSKMPTPAAQGVPKKFTIDVGDVTADLTPTNDASAFRFRYKIQESDGTGQAVTEIVGNPSETNFVYTFQSPGVATVSLWVKDKDMSAWSASADFTFTIEVSDHPSLSIESEFGDAIGEGTVGISTSKMFLKLSENTSNLPLDFEIEVKSADTATTKPGTLRLGGLTNKLDAAGHTISNVYCGTLAARQTSFSFYIDESDGTKASMQKGFVLKPSITTQTEVPTAAGKKWSEYFVVDSFNLAVQNVAPTIVCSLGEENSATNAFPAAIGNGDVVTWSVDDIAGIDLAAGLTVQWWSTDYGNETSTNVTDNSEATFTPRFKSSGVKQVRVTVTDKDKDTGAGTATMTWYFEVQASKTLVTTATGPSAGTATSKLSQKYARQSGIGEGHVFTEGSFAGAAGFSLTWNCALAQSIGGWAWGYKVGAVDNGNLDSQTRFKYDVPLDAMGYNTTDGKSDLTGYYAYPDLERDSFFYAWLLSTTENGSTTTVVLGDTASPEFAGRSVPKGIFALPDQMTGDGLNYPVTYVEAVFSKELKVQDNMGDINQDGVPDFFAVAKTYGESEGTIREVDSVGGDLANLKAANDDGDFLPAANQLYQASIVPGANSDWTGGLPFTVPLEIRGWSDGLNYGMFQFDAAERRGWVSDIDMSLAEKKALKRWAEADTTYADEAQAMLDSIDGDALDKWLSDMSDMDVYTNQQALAKAYISRTWSKFASTGEWGFTVENRTDPTAADTDGDGMADGYEYYFWYAATVGFGDDGKTIVGSKFNLEDVESPTEITSAEIASTFNPNVSLGEGNPWLKQDTDGDGLLDTEEVLIGTNPVRWDTDGDRLSDLYEVLYGIDPLLNNAKGNSGAFNGDGDFMAKADLGTFSIYEIRGRTYAVSYIASIEMGEPGPGTNTMTVIGFPVYAFAGGYMPTTERFTESASKMAYRFTYLDGEEPEPRTGNVSLYHYQVYNYYGFDPRTGWYQHNDASVSKVKRWFKKGNPRSAGMAQNTAEFSALDEFRLIKYRYLMGLASYSKDASDIAKDENPIQKLANVLVARTTNPNAPLDAKTVGSRSYDATVHGADTDQDGVPDGWELYVGVNPNVHFADQVNEGLYNVIRSFDADDGLVLDEEFAGTDSCGAYDGCETIYANHPSQPGGCMPGWYNKFFPTDPRADDTDGDGIDDGKEGQSWDGPLVFNRWGQAKYGLIEGQAVRVNHIAIYGSPEPGIKRCVPGGGLNPCSIDTDMDGLPDPWERRYAGLLFNGSDLDAGVLSGVSALDPEVYDDIREAAFAFNNGSSTNDTSYYVCMGMDPTVFDSNSNEELRDKDWDGDGLENWQEYLVQALRHLRYDDCVNPLNGYDMPVQSENGGTTAAFCGARGYIAPNLSGEYNAKELDFVRNELGYASFADFAAANPGYLATLGYFAAPPREWDPMYIDFEYQYMMPPQALQQMKTTKLVNDSTNELGHVVWTGTKYTYDYNWFDGRAEMVLSTDPADAIVYTNNTDEADVDAAFTLISVTNALLTVRTDAATNNYYLTTTAVPEETYSDEWLKASSYVSTDPRLWDTDADGMDDFYELFHGLNPILGNPGTLSVSERATTFGVVEVASVLNANDVIASAYGTGINVYRNGYVGWSNTEVPGYDPIRYPWLMGVGACDADGDGLRNEEEALLVNLASPGATHTDPTPLWMTDSTVGSDDVPVTGTMAFTNTTVITEVTFPDGTVYVLPSDQWIVWRNVMEVATTNSWITTYRSPSYTAQYYHSPWKGPTQDPTNEENDGKYGWGVSSPFSFELNEGYDTDADWKSDGAEQASVVEPTSDPQDFYDPSRRQSLTFGSSGGRGVAISVEPATRTTYTSNADFLRQFTVEAWVRPETAASGAPQYVVTRSLNYGGWDLSNSVAVVRNNFALGITADGKAFASFDNSTDGSVSVEGSTLADGVWTHVAATFDGAELKIYVNGTEIAAKQTTLQPANGVTEILQDPQTESRAYFPVVSYLTTEAATVLGGRAASKSAFSASGIAGAASWDDVAADFYRGSLDEVRVWDGARTPEQIQSDFRKRYDVDKVRQLRLETYYEYASGARRNDSMGEVYGETLSAELIQHYSFAALPGAKEPANVQKVPAGFEGNVAAMVNDDVGRDAIKVGWWNRVATSEVAVVGGQVYVSGYAVPWIQNTVAHLPRLSGNVEDSVFWNEYLAGYTPASFQKLSKFDFANTMNPYCLTAGSTVDGLTSLKFTLLNNADSSTYGELRERFRYDIRRGFTGSTDLVPLGDAFAKRLSESWDGEGPEDAWAVTTDGSAADGDPDDDGIPDWAAAAGYADAEAYARALAQGLMPDGALDPDFASAADLDSNGIPDWWQNVYNVGDYTAHDDPDHDGLSIWQEYLVSQGAAYGSGVGADNWPSNLNPRASITDESMGRVRDYFRAGGGGKADQYIGEIVGDHDFMEDWWERSQGASYASTTVYDPYSDADGDGWSSWAECRYSLFTAMINASAISHAVGGYEVKDMPVPAVRLTLAYAGDPGRIAGAPLVLQTFTAASATRADATFTIAANSTNEYSRFIGMWGERTVRGTLTPGHIDQNSLSLQFLGIDRNEDYSWNLWNENLTRYVLYHGTYEEFLAAVNEYRMYGWTWYNPVSNTSRRGRVELLSSTGTWMDFDESKNSDISVTTDDEGRHGYICALGERLGTIDLVTGDYAIDLTALGNLHLSSGGSNTVNISSSLIRMKYSAGVPNVGANRLDVSLGDADEGYVREGENTIVAFYDIDGDGAYTAGEPFGTVSGVDVGWCKTARTVIELSETSPVMPRVTLVAVDADRRVVDGDAGRVTLTSSGAGASGTGASQSASSGALRATYRIVRTAINGEATSARPTVFSRTLSLANRSFLHEGDVLAAGRLGLDWGTLATGVRRMGLEPENVNSVEYALEKMTVDTNGVAGATEILRFVNTYNTLRGKAVPVSPKGGQVVSSARPEFRWTSSDGTMTAFRLQVRVADGEVVYDSGDTRLPGAVDGEYAFQPDLYVGFAATNGASAFLDATNYQWRVALMNPKFSETAESDWSDWSSAAFACRVESADGSLTDCGKVAAAVRYYGPASFEAADVVVEAYDTPDFSGAPLARTRLGDKSLVGDRHDIATTNALLSGVLPGDVYLLAFVDRNNNGVRDRFETWGYANQVDVYTANIYSPNPVEVKAEAVKVPSATIYMEDTDVNQNGVVDALEELPDMENATYASDADADGLSDSEESVTYGTDPYLWDTDGDGMPDGWELVFAETNPFTPDSDFAADGDVMAYAEVPGTLVSVWDGANESTVVSYLLPRDASVAPVVGDEAAGLELVLTWEYGEQLYAYGSTVTMLSGKVYDVKGVTSVLVHAQVYSEFGFSRATANPASAETVNTKPFTALDKYLVVRYLESLGFADEAAVNTNRQWKSFTVKPGVLDFDRDGMADGWELYTMFGPAGANDAMSISPWNATDRYGDPDGDGLANVYEFDGGFLPTDPWDGDTDKDGIGDRASNEYMFKYGGAGDGKTGYRGDADNDQLSNFIEYLISGLDGFPETDPGTDLDPSAMSTFAGDRNQLVPDYFLPCGRLYLGEMFADHDMIEDWWEDEQPVEEVVGGVRTANYSRYRYDAAADTDGDGWSNWAEARLMIAGGKVAVDTVSTNAVGEVVTNTVEKYAYGEVGRPTPTISAALRYNSSTSEIAAGDTLVVKAWSAKKSTLGECDAAWVTSVGTLGEGFLQVELGEPTSGTVHEGENMFVAYVVSGGTGSDSGSGSSESSTETVPEYSVGKPYGVATGVKVGFLRGAPFSLELTDIDPTMARINLVDALAIQRACAEEFAGKNTDWWDSYYSYNASVEAEYNLIMKTYFTQMADECTDRKTVDAGYAALHCPAYLGTNLVAETAKSVHLWTTMMLVNGQKRQNYYSSEIFNAEVPFESHPVITEADLLSSGSYDLGWNVLRSSMGSNWSVITSAVFGIVFEVPPTDYSAPNNLLLVEMENRYEGGSAQTKATYLDVAESAGQPTFKWRHDNSIGKPYPAFQLRVWTKDEKTLVFDSGVQRAPVRDQDGVYSWTAPIWAGAMTTEGVVFEADVDYVWGVSMLDAKFTEPLRKASLEGRGNVRIVDASGSAGLSDYGSIAVAVKYMGPYDVNTNGTKGIVRVEAYESPDFSGHPVGVGFVRNKASISDIDKIALNALVKNLPKRGEYYVVAYLDLDGDGVRQDWESWGYGCYVGDESRRDVYTPRAYGVGMAEEDDLKFPTCVIYLEDCDVNNNKLPDALEVDGDGEFSPQAAPADKSPYVVTVDASGTPGALSVFQAIQPDVVNLPYYSTLVEMENGGTISAPSLALAMSGIDISRLNVEPSVTIIGFTKQDGIAIEVDPCATVDGSTLFPTPVNVSVRLKITFEWTPNLATAWTDCAETTDTLPIDGKTVFDYDAPALSNTVNKKIKEIGEEYPDAFFRIKSVEVVD